MRLRSGLLSPSAKAQKAADHGVFTAKAARDTFGGVQWHPVAIGLKVACAVAAWSCLAGVAIAQPSVVTPLDTLPAMAPAVTASGPVDETHRRTLIDAIALLPADVRQALPPIHLIKLGDEAREQWLRSHTSPDGYVTSEAPGVINVPAFSQMFEAAMHGDRGQRIKLASLLAHEAWHVQHGTDEGGAYAEQLRILRDLKAPRAVIRGVEDALEYTLHQHRTPPTDR